MVTVEKDLGKGGFIYMVVLTVLIFIALIATALFIDTQAIMASPDPGPLEWAMWLIMCLSIPFVLYHSALTKGFYPALTAMAITIFAAWLAEGVGVNYGWWFGSYHYTHLFNPKIWGVPIIICIAWEPILYGAYMVTDFLFPVELNKERPMWQKLTSILLLSLIGAFVTTLMDLFGDPDAVERGWWIWHGGGPYFPDLNGGVPVQNFIGWIKLSFICHVVYRLAGLFSKHERHSVYLDIYTAPLLWLQIFIFVESFAILYLRRADVALIGMGMGTFALVAVVKAVMYKMGYWRDAYKYLEE